MPPKILDAYLAPALALIRRDLGFVVSERDAIRRINLDRDLLRIPSDVTGTAIIEAMQEAGSLTPIELAADPYAGLKRLGSSGHDLFDIARSLRSPSAYFSHGTAVFLNGLTNDIPTTLYLNLEQTPKPAPTGPLTQHGIDRAFASLARESAMTYRCDLGQITILSGKNTGNAEVGTARTIAGREVATTKLERTLLDIAVRPNYAGGIFKVAQAYEEAVRRGISSNALVSCLERLGHRYPYHQAVGFLLERAGATDMVLDRLRAYPRDFDFYLHNRIANPVYVEAWRLYVPSGL